MLFSWKMSSPNLVESPANPVELAALIGNLNMLKVLLENQNYNPNQEGTRSTTLLHYACDGGHLGIVKYLIDEHQVDPLSKDDYERTPLHVASRKGHLDIVRYLVDEQSIDPEYACDDSSMYLTPLHSACKGGHLDIYSEISY